MFSIGRPDRSKRLLRGEAHVAASLNAKDWTRLN
jgi:hypothetical protein